MSKKFICLITFLCIIQCRETVTRSEQNIVINQAKKIMTDNPREALRLLSTISDSTYRKERMEILFQIYLDQREYQRAQTLLDSQVKISSDTLFLLKLKLNQSPIAYTEDVKTKAIQHTIYENWEEALKLFSKIDSTDPVVQYYHLKALIGGGDSGQALKIAKKIDNLPKYLISDYHKIMVDLQLWSDPAKALQWVDVLKNSMLKLYYKYQITNKEKYLWQLIRSYPKSWAGQYALRLIKPKTKKQYLTYGKALFQSRQYARAIGYLKRVSNIQAQFLIGMCLLRQGEKSQAYGYLRESGLPEAYYAIAQTLPDSEAIDYYKFVTSKKPRRSLKRNAMISHAMALERTGRIDEAVEVELDFIEEFPGTETSRRLLLRSAMNLIRLGDLKKADSILSLDSLTAFYYWRGKIRAMQNESPDSFYQIVKDRAPFSYYSIYRLSSFPEIDTAPLRNWVASISDSTIPDTAILEEVDHLISLGLIKLADKAVWSFSTYDPYLLYRVIIKSEEIGFDWHAIRFARRLIRKGEKLGKKSFPLELIRLAYPVRYIPSLTESAGDITILMALIWQESNFNPNAISPAGAIGLLQIMPRTGQLIASELREPYDSDSLYNPMVSIRYGVHYLVGLKIELNSWIWALVGYNAGPHRIRKWIKTYPVSDPEIFIELIPFAETRNYVKRILMLNEIYKRLIDLRDLS